MRVGCIALASLQLALVAGCGGAEVPPAEVAIPTPIAPPTAVHTGARSRTPRIAETALFRALPMDCKSRVYIHAETLLGPSGARSLDAAIEAFFKLAPGIGASATRDAARDVGLGIASIREAALCFQGSKDAAFAVRVDPRVLKTDPTEAFSAVLAASGTTPTREQRADVTYLEAKGTAIAVIGDVATVSDKADVLADAILVGAGAAGFADARGHVLWARSDDLDGGLVESRMGGSKAFRLDATIKPPSSYEADWAKEPSLVIARLRADADELKARFGASPLSVALPIFEGLMIERAGDRVHLDTSFQAIVVEDALAAASKMPLSELAGLLR